MTVATLTVPKFGDQEIATFSFLAWSTDAQWSPDFRQNELEELAPYGTTDVRYRVVRRAFPQFEVRTLATAASYAAARLLGRQYIERQGRIATLRLFSPVSVQMDVHIVAVPAPVCRSGLISGQTGTGVVDGAWVLRRAITKELGT